MFFTWLGGVCVMLMAIGLLYRGDTRPGWVVWCLGTFSLVVNGWWWQ